MWRKIAKGNTASSLQVMFMRSEKLCRRKWKSINNLSEDVLTSRWFIKTALEKFGKGLNQEWFLHCLKLALEISNSLPCKDTQFNLVRLLSHVLSFCDPINCSTPGLPVHHQLWKLTQLPVHWVSDAIQPSHPLSPLLLLPPIPPSIRVFPVSQLFSWGGQSIGVSASTSFLPMNTRTDLL